MTLEVQWTGHSPRICLNSSWGGPSTQCLRSSRSTSSILAVGRPSRWRLRASSRCRSRSLVLLVVGVAACYWLAGQFAAASVSRTALKWRDGCYKDMNRYRLDDFIEYTLSKRGRENMALAALAASCVAGIVVIGRL